MNKSIKFSFKTNQNTSSGGGGLYSGINLDGDTNDVVSAENTTAAPPKTVEPSPSAATESSSKPEPEKKDSQAWSASLAFAPLPRKRPNSNNNPNTPIKKPPPTGTLSTSSSSKLASATLTTTLSPKTQAQASSSLSATATKHILASSSNSNSNNASTARSISPSALAAAADHQPSRPLPPVLEAPPLALDDEDMRKVDFDMRHAQNSKDDRKGKKGRKQRRQANDSDLTASFMTKYDALRPTDYSEWKTYVRFRREERKRQAYEEERRRRDYGSESDYDDDDDEEEESEDEHRRRRWGGPERFFAPPKSYEDNAPAPTSAPAPVNREETGEEAYQRRLAMSRQTQPQPPQQSSSVPSPSQSPPPPQQQPSHLVAEPSAEEAYQKSLELSRKFANLPDNDDENDDEKEGDVGEEKYNSNTHPGPIAPPAFVSSNENSAAAPTDAEAKARAIAEKFAKLAETTGNNPDNTKDKETSIPPEIEEKGTFAEKLMAKYGWKQGQGLGANESGMVNPLSVNVAQAPETGGKKKKKVKQQQQVPEPQINPSSMAGNIKGRGNIVSEQAIENKKAQREKYGEPTSIVLLTNIVGLEDADDEDLPGEIAGEAQKHGKVYRCFVHPRPSTTPDGQVISDGERVRVFLQFDGLAGAWNAVREFDGRFFGGRQVRARFFDETKFHTSQYDAPAQ